MSVSGRDIVVTFPDEHTEMLQVGDIVRFYFNDAENQLVAYLGRGVIEQQGTHLVLPALTLGECTGVPEPCGETPANDWPVKMEVATDGVGESWINVLPTSAGDDVGIFWQDSGVNFFIVSAVPRSAPSASLGDLKGAA